MAIDPSIALGFRPPEAPSQLNMLAQAMQLQGMQRQNQMGALDMQDRQAAAAEREALRNYLAGGANLDTPEGQAGLFKAAPTMAAKIQKDRLDLKATQSQIGEREAQTRSHDAQTRVREVELVNKTAEQFKNFWGQVQTPQQAQQLIAQAYAHPVLGKALPGTAEEAASRIPTDPAQFGQYLQRQILGADEFIKLNQDVSKKSQLAQLISERDALPANSQLRAIYDNAIQKQTTHAPAATAISYGAPVIGVNPKTGEPELYRPDNKGGMSETGIKPPPQNRDTKMPAEIQRMNIAADTMDKMLNDYEAMLGKYNPRDPLVQGNPTIRAEFQSLMKGIQLQFKEVQALGALAGPDLGIMEAAITDPFTFKGAFYGKDGLMAQIKQGRNLLKTRREAIVKNTGQPTPPGAAPPDSDPLGLRK